MKNNNPCQIFLLATLFLCFFGCALLYKQGSTTKIFEGQVLRAQSKEPLVNAQVSLMKKDNAWFFPKVPIRIDSTQTDNEGRYFLQTSEFVPIKRLYICVLENYGYKNGSSCTFTPKTQQLNLITVPEDFVPEKKESYGR
jgi:hypothetical protein